MNGSFSAPMLFEGTTNTDVVNLWLQKVLLPQLPPDRILVWDNAAFHKNPATETIIKNAGHGLVSLPPYSPDLNPIEHDFANLKRRRSLYPDTPLDVLVTSYQ
jgi:putative transposase